jgi:hypothetical protein
MQGLRQSKRLLKSQPNESESSSPAISATTIKTQSLSNSSVLTQVTNFNVSQIESSLRGNTDRSKSISAEALSILDDMLKSMKKNIFPKKDFMVNQTLAL